MKQFLTPDELLEEYGFGKKWQDKMRGLKLIPYSKLGGYIRYSREEIDRWIISHRVVSFEPA
jgi:predicted DNA-binding transcriptional regulator AlpA